MKEQPCLTCTRVENPEDCDLKGCAAWREWWLARWDNMRCRYWSAIKRVKENDNGQ